jgi:GNAT superfamily N-acetyltransferase
MITYNWIDGYQATEKEWDEIDSILAARGWMSLNKNTSRIRIAYDGEKIVGLYVFQLIPHVEPLWVSRSYIGQGIAEHLISDMEQFFIETKARGCMIVAENPLVEKLCISKGMAKVNYPVYVLVGEVNDGQ